MDTPLTLGTAGHVDHGKTRLVEALTGTHTDRLPEERARGISIELGYAQLTLPNGRRLSLIDVPGHERFVHTMVAGATGIDLFLLVVDAAEGPRAQTYEHLSILRLLQIDRGVVAVTKIDATPAETVAQTIAATRELLPASTIIPVSARTGEGIPELLAALQLAAPSPVRTRRSAPTRLYVDRVITVAGVGTVVTGTLLSGTISAGDRLDVLPSGFEARIRSVQVHGEPAEQVEAGQRVAASLVTANRRKPRRGDALAEKNAYAASYRLDISLDHCDDVPRGARIQVCHGTSAITARLVRIGQRFAQLRLEQPIVAARGDHLVLRREGTIGGGRVLDPHPPRRTDERRLERLDSDDPGALVAGLVDAPVRIEEIQRRLLLDQDQLDHRIESVNYADGWLYSTAWIERIRAEAHAKLTARAGTVDPGLPANALLGDLPWTQTVARQLGLRTENGKLYLADQVPQPSMSPQAEELRTRLSQAGLEPIRIDDTALGILLEQKQELIRLGNGLAIGRDAYDQARKVLAEECNQAGTVTVARYRDLLGVSRRVAQLLLDRFDADRITLRIGDERRLRRAGRDDQR